MCNDSVLRIWDRETTVSLKGILIEAGMPTCMSFSKNMEYLLVGTRDGYVLGYDGGMLGTNTIRILSKKVANMSLQSVCWFHYSGEGQSYRFLILTEDSSVRLYSMWFEKMEGRRDHYEGNSSELSLLYSSKQAVEESYRIESHSFANFIFFSPGILLYMVDHYPLIYYPIIVKQPSISF